MQKIFNYILFRLSHASPCKSSTISGGTVGSGVCDLQYLQKWEMNGILIPSGILRVSQHILFADLIFDAV